MSTSTPRRGPSSSGSSPPVEEALERVRESPRQREEFLRAVGDNLPKSLFYQVVHFPDGKYRFVYVSQGVEELAGVTVEDVLEHPDALTNPILEEDRAAFFAAMEHALVTLTPFDHVCRKRLADGIHWCHFRSSVRPGGDGTIVCEGIEMDITDLRLAEDALHEIQARSQLDRLEIARASRLTLLGEIAASLAHELNQPLAAIVSNAQAGQRFIAVGAADSADLGGILRDIAEQGTRAGEVIKRLRGWIDRQPTPRAPLSVSQVVAEVEHLLRSELILRHVRLDTDLRPAPPKVVADRVQLQQVVVNLVLNAVDAMRDRSPRDRVVTIRTSSKEASREVAVEVSDRGTGISPDHLDVLFDAFFTTKQEGLGMGLRICSSIVRAHGGRIWADNNASGGATFCFTLPIADSP